jgi:hypothetical protein
MRYLEERFGKSGSLHTQGAAFFVAITMALWTVPSLAKATPGLTVSATALSFFAVEGASNSPMQSLTISTTGSETGSWVAASGAPWIQVIPSAGVFPSSVLVSANVAGMTPGTYSGTIFITSIQTGASQVVSILLTLTPKPSE